MTKSPVQHHYLFVYGTLLRRISHPMAEFLHENSSFVENGYFQGRLYDVDVYPGAILSTDPDDQVYGNILGLKDPEKVWKKLDPYEGYLETNPDISLYIKQFVDVYAGEQVYSCWVYLYNKSVNDLTRIISGDYLSYLSHDYNR